MYLLSIKLVELGLRAISTPQAQNFGLGTVGHVDELLIPPALIYCPDVTPQYHTVIAHLEECTKSSVGRSLTASSIPGHVHVSHRERMGPLILGAAMSGVLPHT